jgi:peptide/nickel transport system ATP-binding protein
MRQRAMIAMALSCDPGLLIADEPTTALDVTVQAQILDLIVDLQSEFGSGVIIITHDLGVVAEVADEVLVMYAGRVAETGSANDLFRQPGHPYAWGLLGSMPRLDAARIDRLRPIPGTPPSLINVPAGCPFHPRCTYQAQATGGVCDSDIPELREVSPGHRVSCHLSVGKQREIWQRLSDPAVAASPDPAAAAAPADSADPAAASVDSAALNGEADPTEEADPNEPTEQSEVEA